MSTDRDIERVLDAWLATGPSEMPDRVFDDALDRIERVPQRRIAWPRRFPTMLDMSKLPVAAAVAALALGLATITLLPGPRDAVMAPAASAAASATPASATPASATPASATPASAPPAMGPLPEALQVAWAAAPRRVDGLDLSESVARWRVAAGTFRLEDQGIDLAATATAVGPDRLRLESLSGRGCDLGDVGVYAWSLRQDGSMVSLTAVSDDCAARASLLNGDWFRIDCDILDTPCRGPLEAGRHESVLFDARAREHPAARLRSLSFEVPDGWANAEDGPSAVRLVPVEGYMRRVADADVETDVVAVFARPMAIRADAPACQVREDPTGGTTVESLAAWLTSHPELVTSEPQPITIAGHAGLSIDLDMAPGAGQACDTLFTSLGVLLFADSLATDAGGNLTRDPEWGLVSGFDCPDCTSDPQRIILLDLDGVPLVILIDSEKPEDQAAFVEEAMPIVESFGFSE